MMEPIYRCGYQIPSLIKLVFKLICFITIPFLITMMVKNLIVTNGIAVDHSFSFIIYPISLLITLGFVYSYRNSSIYLFYNNFMLYKEKLNLHDRMKLFFM